MSTSREITTKDLADFGFRELKMAAELLTAYCEMPPEFLEDGVHLMMNRHSGNVFLTDEEFNVAMMNEGKLDAFLFTPYHGHEGFIDELAEQYSPDDLNSEDAEFIRHWADRLNFTLPDNWQLEAAHHAALEV